MSAVLTLAEELARILASPGGLKVLEVATDPLATRDDVARAISTMSELAPKPIEARLDKEISTAVDALTQPVARPKEKTMADTLSVPVKMTVTPIARATGVEWSEVIAWAPAIVDIYSIGKAAWNARPAEESSALKFTYAAEAAFPHVITFARQVIADWAD